MALSRFFNKIHRLQINKFWRYFENTTPRPNFGNFFIGNQQQQQQKSLYSSDTKAGRSSDNKCKKVEPSKGPTKCPSFKLANCPERYKYEAVCRKQPHLKECKKQEAPYPAYSDTCHTILEQKPSECKDCPYRPDPNYLPPKRRLHTSTRSLSGKKDGGKGKLPDCPTGPSAYNRADYNNPQPCNPKPDNTKNCPDDLLELKRKKPPRPKRPDH